MEKKNKTRNTKVPLLVKELILPGIKKPGPSHICNTSSFMKDNSCNGKETRENASSCLRIGCHEVKAVRELKNLSKNYQEDYFSGTKKKNQNRRVKHQRVHTFLNEFSFKESQNRSEIPTPKKDSLSLKEIIERNKLQQKIQAYEKMKEDNKRSNDIKQRLAEETYIRQQENLFKTWGKIVKRENQLKQNNFHDLRLQYNKRTTTSQCLNDDKDESLKKTEKKSEEVDDMEKKLFEKLVFVNDELESSYSKF